MKVNNEKNPVDYSLDWSVSMLIFSYLEKKHAKNILWL